MKQKNKRSEGKDSYFRIRSSNELKTSFKMLCQMRGATMSNAIEHFIRGEVEKNAKLLPN
jgi:hypothetical protein